MSDICHMHKIRKKGCIDMNLMEKSTTTSRTTSICNWKAAFVNILSSDSSFSWGWVMKRNVFLFKNKIFSTAFQLIRNFYNLSGLSGGCFYFFTKIEQNLKNVFFQKVRFLQQFPPKILFLCLIFVRSSQQFPPKNFPAGHLLKKSYMGNMYNT